jgi:hypothetical protein
MTVKNFVEGINIIAKYITKEFDMESEHGQFYFGAYNSVTNQKDIAKLWELGWFEEEAMWSCYI